MTTEFKHPPTPPAIPGNFIPLPSKEEAEIHKEMKKLQLEAPVLTQGERLTLLVASLPPEARTPFDPHTMSIGAISVAALLEDAA